jgi:hypothetical protein
VPTAYKDVGTRFRLNRGRSAVGRFTTTIRAYRDVGARFAVALPVPLAPTLTLLAQDSTVRVDQAQTFTWTFNEPTRAGATQAAYAFKRRRLVGNTVEWWRASDSAWVPVETWNATATASVTIGASAWTGYDGFDYAWTVATQNDQGGNGPYADERRVRFSLRVDPTITGPATVATANFNITWSVTRQSAFQVRLLQGATVIKDSGKVAEKLTRSYNVGPAANGAVLTLEVTTWNDDDLQSAVVTVSRTVAYVSAPSIPTIVVTTPLAPPHARIVITNPGGGDTVVSNEVWRSTTGVAGSFTRVATGVALNGTYDDFAVSQGGTYYYFVRAIGTSDTIRDSAVA